MAFVTSHEMLRDAQRRGYAVGAFNIENMEMAQWLSSLGLNAAQIAAAERDALLWALERGSRSGRVAQQFARDYAGRPQAEAPVHQRIADVHGLSDEVAEL